MGQDLINPAEQIQTALEIFHESGDVFEVRAFHSTSKSVAAGHFEDPAAAAHAALRLEADGFNVFRTLNPVRNNITLDLNRITHGPQRLTAAPDIVVRNWLLLDLDPVRPSGVCATDSEYAAARAKGHALLDHLCALGWPMPVLVSSGNGLHLVYRIELPNDEDGTRLVAGCLHALAVLFDDAVVKIDQTVKDAPRVARLPGTLNKKGPNTVERAHRRAYLIDAPVALLSVPTVLLQLLAALPSSAPDTGAGPSTPPAARVPAVRLVNAAVTRIEQGNGRNDSGLWFFVQLRDNQYSRAEAELTVKDWVARANAAAPGGDRYTMGEARATLAQAFKREARKPFEAAPAIGSGLVQEIDRAIKQEHHFARDEGGLLYVFESGCYRPTGERFVEQAVKRYVEQNGKARAWSPELASRIVSYIATDAPQLLAKPPLDTLNVRNGLLNVYTRVLRPHAPDFLSPVQVEASYDPKAGCLAIDQFVSDVFPADAAQVPWEVAAWLMLPETSIQKAVLTIGEGANGKSVFLSLLHAFLGRSNVSALSLHKIEADKFAAARLVGKLANICPDLPTVALSGTLMFKALTGGDTITGERKFEASFEFRPYSRLVFSANSAPRSDDATHGFFRRWLVIPFTRTFDETDVRTVPRAVLDARLSAPGELSGLLNRALDALPQIQSGKFTESPTLRAAWEDFRRTTDPLAVWLESVTIEVLEGFIEKAKLRELYRNECRDRGHPVLSDEVFTKRLLSLRPRVRSTKRRVNGMPTWCFVGIGLRAQESDVLY